MTDLSTHHPSGVDGAIAFLRALDGSKELREEVKKLQHICELAKRHHYNFTNDDLEKALLKKWGRPKDDPEARRDEPYTCCCVSEVPGF